ncbi:hypothetical protein HPT29_003795 [Microvirga terrae]|uniref:Nuclear transport factor 2 family protein n=1 Tax=Microvirga terrae TaxID=2740529 RepID=A0ABY5RSP5_9HYPH|nr:hypothetical protein [Microvirga terrae]UVF20283.1 hypothetical protein HPT29_003795 [Microvirga terrae]
MRSLRTVEVAAPLREHWDMQAFEEVLACNIKDVIADFCLTDAEIIRFYADNQLHGNMDEMVTSSAELYFKGETLSYGYVAHVSAEREDAKHVVLDMEFVHDSVTVFFKIIFGNYDIGVQISEVLLDTAICQSDFNPSSFEMILSSARLRPLPARFKSSYCPAGALRH